MTALELLKSHVQTGRQFLEGTFADVTPEMLHKAPGGTANPLGATYAHLIFSEDWLINNVLRGKKMLAETEWAGKTGVDKPMPNPGPEWGTYADWTKTVKIDLDALRSYAKAVYENTDKYLSSLSDADLDKEKDLTAVGFGKVTVGWAIAELIAGHTTSILGEIAVLKGIQGAKGYPF